MHDLADTLLHDNLTHGSGRVRFNFYFDIEHQGLRIILLLKFRYNIATDWYQARVFRGDDVIGYTHGYANRAWSPQVNNIWVAAPFRRKGIASTMMARVEDYFGQVPLPATRIADNDAARRFWENYISDEEKAVQRLDRRATEPRRPVPHHDPAAKHRLFFHLPHNKAAGIFLMEFQHNQETDWYEARLFKVGDLLGYLNGYANEGWNPIVQNIWITEKYRRKGLASIMLSKIENYFGRLPLPAESAAKEPGIRQLWQRYTSPKKKGSKAGKIGRWTSEQWKEFFDRERRVMFRLLIEKDENGEKALFLLDFQYDKDGDWFAVELFRGELRVGLTYGFGHSGWNPQVSYMWVAKDHRRKGLATLMISKTEEYFGRVPLPGVGLQRNRRGRAFWKKFFSTKTGGRTAGKVSHKEPLPNEENSHPVLSEPADTNATPS
jgi:GNAT superfamily N-acetyltransferase